MSQIEMLELLLVGVIFLIVILTLIYIYLKIKNNKKGKNNNLENGLTNSENTKGKNTGYTKESVFDFMEFSSIEDNMIIQNDLKRYLMVIECEGINYDLMSQVEKASVEMGFIQFLNTLTFPIQLYIQTRSVNITDSILSYKEKLNEIENQIRQKQIEHNKYIQSRGYDDEQGKKMKYEINRQIALYEYGKDVIKNIEMMSLNKNVLNKHYYIVVAYYENELGNSLTDKSERRGMIFSELYTRAESLVKSLMSCSIKGRILDSYELVDLLYVAYNRDDSDIYSVKRAIESGYEELYSTGEDILEKRMKAIDQTIAEKGQELAVEIIDEVKEREIKEKEQNLKDLINEAAREIIEKNKDYLGEDVVEEGKKALKKRKETETIKKGGKKNEKKGAK